MEQEYYNDFMEIDLKELIRILLRKWWIIAIFFITAVTVSFVVSFIFSNLYIGRNNTFRWKEIKQANQLGEIKLNDELVSDANRL